MPEVHICPTWKTSHSLDVKTSIPMSAQGCLPLSDLSWVYVNTTPRYLGWFKTLDHILMLVDWDKILRREETHFKHRKRSHWPGGTLAWWEGNPPRLWKSCSGMSKRHVQEVWELGRDMHFWASGPCPQIHWEHYRAAVYCLGHFLQKRGKSML